MMLSCLWLLSVTLSCSPQTMSPARGLPTFADYTVPSIPDATLFERLARAPHYRRDGLQGVKFIITSFAHPEARAVRFLDGEQYRYHDEWYWFHLLNGQPTPFVNTQKAKVVFATPAAARAWAQTHRGSLPEGITLIEDRVVAQEFYDLSMNLRPRVLGAGTLIHLPRSGGRAAPLWGFLVDPLDVVDADDLATFHGALAQALPPNIAAQLVFVHQTEQHRSAALQLLHAGQVAGFAALPYAALGQVGQEQVYSPGLSAGRLFHVRDLAEVDSAPRDAILLLDTLPSTLPHVHGILSSVPQTPLSHLTLLAKNRGVLNAYRGGLTRDTGVLALAERHAPVAVSATGGGLHIVPMAESQYEEWLNLRHPPILVQPAGEWLQLPYLLPIGQSRLLASAVGGKASGMQRLMVATRDRSLGASVPYRPLAITPKAFIAHHASLTTELRALFEDRLFRKDAAVRYLCLEGRRQFRRRFGASALTALTQAEPSLLGGSPAARWLARGGVRPYLRKRELSEELRKTILRPVRAHFAALGQEQKLRFRSSSTLEDMEGFNGAGLYTSSTGSPAVGISGGKGSLEWALLKTWASYFSFEAFEEREHFGLDSLSGAMGVLVHPRFDDSQEEANGVFTLTLGRTGQGFGGEALINVQAGTASVTNPEEGAPRPEILQVTSTPTGPLTIERKSYCTALPPGTAVLTDQQARELFRVGHRVASNWLREEAQRWAPERAPNGVSLDFEFRVMAAGWRAEDETRSSLVLKQVRSLEPPQPPLSTDSPASRIPRNILARSKRVQSVECANGDGAALIWTEVATSDARAPQFALAQRAFIGQVWFRWPNLPALASIPVEPCLWPEACAGTEALWTANHLAMVDRSAGLSAVEPALWLELLNGYSLTFGSGSAALLEGNRRVSDARGLTCRRRNIYESDEGILERLLRSETPDSRL